MINQKSPLDSVFAEYGIGFWRFETNTYGSKIAVFCYNEPDDGVLTTFTRSLESISMDLLSDGMPADVRALMADVSHVELLRYRDELTLDKWISKVEIAVHHQFPSAQFDYMGDSLIVRDDEAQILVEVCEGYVRIAALKAPLMSPTPEGHQSPEPGRHGTFGIRVSHVKHAADAIVGALS